MLDVEVKAIGLLGILNDRSIFVTNFNNTLSKEL